MQPVFTIKDSFSFGWTELKKNFWFLVLLGLGTFVISMIVENMGGGDTSALGLILGFAVNIFAAFTFTRIGLEAVRGRSFGWNDVF